MIWGYFRKHPYVLVFSPLGLCRELQYCTSNSLRKVGLEPPKKKIKRTVWMLRKVRGLQLLTAIIKMVERKRIYGIYVFFPGNKNILNWIWSLCLLFNIGFCGGWCQFPGMKWIVFLSSARLCIGMDLEDDSHTLESRTLWVCGLNIP